MKVFDTCIVIITFRFIAADHEKQNDLMSYFQPAILSGFHGVTGIYIYIYTVFVITYCTNINVTNTSTSAI